jgi:glycosyltransferase involved in cell wall biosynthesis
MSALPIDPKAEPAKPRSVVFVESAGAMGGVQFSTLYLAQRLNRERWTPIVVCPEEGDLTHACSKASLEVHAMEQTRWRSTSIRIGRMFRLPNPAAWIWNGYAVESAARKLARFLARCQPDLVVTKGLSAHFIGGLGARRLGIPCVWHVQDLISERTFGIYRRAFGRAAHWLPAQIIVDGETIAGQLPRSLQPVVTVIHNGVDVNVFRPGLDAGQVRRELRIPENHVVVGHLGRVTPWKGQHYLIEAFARIAHENSDVTLLLVGSPVFDNDSYQQRLLSMAGDYGLIDRIRFAGYRHDTADVLAAMDIFAFTSIEKDTSPLALLSAMSCGLPIVAFDIAGVRELMTNQDQCRFVPVGDVAALKQALSALISSRELRQRLGASARKLALTEFNLDKYTDRIEQVLDQALLARKVRGAKPALEVTRHRSELRDCV